MITLPIRPDDPRIMKRITRACPKMGGLFSCRGAICFTRDGQAMVQSIVTYPKAFKGAVAEYDGTVTYAFKRRCLYILKPDPEAQP